MTNHIAFYQFCSAVRRKGALTLCLTLCVLGLGLSASAQKHRPTIITFDAPGAGTTPSYWGEGTWAFAINDQGVILGWVIKDENEVHHSYLRAPDGTFTIIDDPVADTGYCRGTNAWNLNQDGTVTGNYEDASDVFHGFLRTPHGSFTTIDVPGAGSTGAPPCNGQGTLIGGRNEAGTVAGEYQDASNVYHGYVRDRHGKITTFDVPGAGTDPGQGTSMDVSTGVINPAGAITGWYCDAITCHGFLRDPHGKFTTFDPPDSELTEPLSINPEGVITGVYCDAITCHGFLRDPHGKFTAVDVPGAPETEAYCINPAGAITGNYYDANGAHGFLRDPHSRFTTFDVPGIAGSTYPNTINSAGAITGTYSDANGVNHGFLRTP